MYQLLPLVVFARKQKAAVTATSSYKSGAVLLLGKKFYVSKCVSEF